MSQNIAKTLTFAVLHFVVGFSVTYAFTGSVAIASGVAIVEPMVNTVVFYFHELGWQRVGADRIASRKSEQWPGINGNPPQTA